jgi:chromosome segregation ATPase
MGDQETRVELHDQTIKRHDEEIKELKDVTYGLPQTLEKITFVVTELSASMKDIGKDMKEFLRVADKKYATKEMCEMCREDIQAEVKEAKDEIKEVRDEQKKMRWGMLSAGAYVAFELFKTYVLK